MLKRFLLRKVVARMLSFVVIALAFVVAATLGRAKAVARVSAALALVLLWWDWRLDVAERRPRPEAVAGR